MNQQMFAKPNTNVLQTLKCLTVFLPTSRLRPYVCWIGRDDSKFDMAALNARIQKVKVRYRKQQVSVCV